MSQRLARPEQRLRVVIADDDPGAREALAAVLADVDGVDVVARYSDGPSALEGIRETRPDVAFLDIQMPGCDGLEVARAIGDDAARAVVFVTAWDRYAIRAFELHAVDYVLKPFESARVVEAVRRAHGRSAEARAEQTAARLHEMLATLEAGNHFAGKRRPLARLQVRDRDRVRFLPVAEIDWIEAKRNYVRVHSAGRSYLMRANLTGLHKRLDARRFVRIHRSIVVNLDRVVEVLSRRGGDGTAVLTDGSRLRVSRTYRSHLLPDDA